MKKITIAILVVALFALMAFGCATKRFVTSTYWYDDTHMYVSYFENEGDNVGPRVLKCDLAEDNSMTCKDQPEVSSLIPAE